MVSCSIGAGEKPECKALLPLQITLSADFNKFTKDNVESIEITCRSQVLQGEEADIVMERAFPLVMVAAEEEQTDKDSVFLNRYLSPDHIQENPYVSVKYNRKERQNSYTVISQYVCDADLRGSSGYGKDMTAFKQAFLFDPGFCKQKIDVVERAALEHSNSLSLDAAIIQQYSLRLTNYVGTMISNNLCKEYYYCPCEHLINVKLLFRTTKQPNADMLVCVSKYSSGEEVDQFIHSRFPYQAANGLDFVLADQIQWLVRYSCRQDYMSFNREMTVHEKLCSNNGQSDYIIALGIPYYKNTRQIDYRVFERFAETFGQRFCDALIQPITLFLRKKYEYISNDFMKNLEAKARAAARLGTIRNGSLKALSLIEVVKLDTDYGVDNEINMIRLPKEIRNDIRSIRAYYH